MTRSWIARTGLILALVFSQTLQAGHDDQHIGDQMSDCLTCLQASSAGLPVPATESGLGPVPHDFPHYVGHVERPNTVAHYARKQTRAPPISLI
jgi:hypothetical protein